MGLTVMLVGNKLEDTQPPSLVFVSYAQNSPNCFSLMPLTSPRSRHASQLFLLLSVPKMASVFRSRHSSNTVDFRIYCNSRNG